MMRRVFLRVFAFALVAIDCPAAGAHGQGQMRSHLLDLTSAPVVHERLLINRDVGSHPPQPGNIHLLFLPVSGGRSRTHTTGGRLAVHAVREGTGKSRTLEGGNVACVGLPPDARCRATGLQTVEVFAAGAYLVRSTDSARV